MSNKYSEVVTILGPTAAGKTELSLKVAKYFDAEIISADSMQIYEGMDIGTAKVSKNIQKEIKHHQIDILKPDQDYSVAEYQKDVDPIIKDIFKRDKLPLIVGGTGLYINAVLEGFTLPEMKPDKDLRKKLRKEAKDEGNQYIHNKLKEIDPKLAEKLHPNDIRRVIRGIEVYKLTGHTKTYYKEKQKNSPPRYQSIKVGLTRNREELYDRIEKRVNIMLDQGLIDEAKHIYNNYDLSKKSTAAQAIGYKELFTYFDGKQSLEQAINLIKRNTRRYAKRQLSFFKRDQSIRWFNLTNISKDSLHEKILMLLKNDLHIKRGEYFEEQN
ncbi:MAG: tRNA (adenosine(37)-N6)-dimethylallyltransferase MiaA [Halanaerobiales bacterium]|nr:tRNA (adenosine(37)-N6)-dimethylallyltransferase MiaA [Halanaerobiales bacterium]